MKGIIKALLTTLINDIEDEYSGTSKFVDGERIVIKINNILDYLMDISKEEALDDLKINLIDIEDMFTIGEIEDIYIVTLRRSLEVINHV